MIGKMIDVVINQKPCDGMSEQVVWKGQGKVLRCVQEGVVLDLNAGGASWWSRFLGTFACRTPLDSKTGIGSVSGFED